MKRLLSLVLLLTLVFGLFACEASVALRKTEPATDTLPQNTQPPTVTETQPPDEPNDCTPLLYRVTDEDGAVLYLFGSIHAADERADDLPAYVTEAYTQSDYLCVECDIYALSKDFTAQSELVSMLMCEPGTTIETRLGTELYTQLKDFLTQEDQYSFAYDYYGPALWLSLLENAIITRSGLDADNGIDLWFLEQAHEEAKEIREVESASFQYELLLSFPDELYRLLFLEYLNNPELAEQELADTYAAWLGGDVPTIERLLLPDYSGISEENLPIYEEYHRAMITDRNQAMADKAEEYLSDGGTGFFVVGLAHIAGDGALAQLLEQRGYTVEVVAP